MSKFLGRAMWCAALLVLSPLVQATDLSNSIVGKVTDGSRTLPYRLFEPVEAKPGQKLPLVVFLHGMGDRGTDNRQQTTRIADLVDITRGGKYASYVLAPQIGTDQWFQSWSNKPTQATAMTINAIKKVVAQENVDPSRIYVTGLSMGGMGTWDIISREPKMFAAAVPMSGGGDVRTASTVKDIPIWAFHGGSDPVVPVEQTRDMVNAIIKAGGHPKYTEVAGGQHDIWGPLYADKSNTLYPWLFSQHLDSAVPSIPAPSAPVDGALSASFDPAPLGNFDASPVPEPGILSLLGIGAMGLLIRRRRANS